MSESKVLIIEDEADMRKVLYWRLKKAGYTATCCSSIAEALKCLEEKSFDVIASDIVLSGKTGFEAIEDLKEKTQSPILLMSGSVTEDMRKDADLLGADGIVQKTGDLEELIERLNQLS